MKFLKTTNHNTPSNSINLGLVGLLTTTMLGFSGMAAAGESVDELKNADNIKHVQIENKRGDINVIGWEQAEIKVAGELDDKAERLIFERSGNSFKIKVVIPHQHGNSWNEQGSQLTINVPQGVSIDFNGVSSDFSIKNTEGSAEINTVSGNINANGLTDNVQIYTVSGEITNQNASGKIALSSVSGDIDDKASSGRLKVKSVSGNLKTSSSAQEVLVNTVSGDAEVSLKAVDELNISTVSGDVEAKLHLNDNGLIKVSSVSGDYLLAMQDDVNATFRLGSSAGGDFINKITNDKPTKAKYGPSSKLTFETGNGSASVRGTTVSGRIKVTTH